MSVVGKGVAVLASVGVIAHGSAALGQSVSGSINAAQAQSVDLFARDRSVSVRERPHPEYEAFGIGLGAFTAFPRLQVDAESNDNIFAVTTGEDNDVIFRVKPEVSLESGWSRHALQAYARMSISRYQDFDTENTEDWGMGAAGRIDITRAANLAAGGDYARLTEPRTSSNAPASTADPVRYDLAQAYVAGARVSGRLKLSARADWRSFDYDDGATLSGVVIDQDNRDRAIVSLSGRGDYAISPDTALFVQVTGNERDYDVASIPLSPARDSSGYEILGGANFELGAVARGEVAAGYISQQFEEAPYSEIEGFGARAQLEWFPTQLTTVTATASRTIEDSGIVGSGGYLSSAVGLQLDHELRRNIILTGQLSYSRDEYDGIDRDDDRFSASVGGTYLVNRRLGVSLAVSHLEQSSSGIDGGADFAVNRLMLSLVTQF